MGGSPLVHSTKARTKKKKQFQIRIQNSRSSPPRIERSTRDIHPQHRLIIESMLLCVVPPLLCSISLWQLPRGSLGSWCRQWRRVPKCRGSALSTLTVPHTRARQHTREQHKSGDDETTWTRNTCDPSAAATRRRPVFPPLAPLSPSRRFFLAPQRATAEPSADDEPLRLARIVLLSFFSCSAPPLPLSWVAVRATRRPVSRAPPARRDTRTRPKRASSRRSPAAAQSPALERDAAARQARKIGMKF